MGGPREGRRVGTWEGRGVGGPREGRERGGGILEIIFNYSQQLLTLQSPIIVLHTPISHIHMYNPCNTKMLSIIIHSSDGGVDENQLTGSLDSPTVRQSMEELNNYSTNN